ncbi:sensor histidine kinase [Actinoplanes sp. URMC 104]|uniref:sensor histidine kinase n=1 Tax=Actinoplanes sp. URMC 104 TaxID=3423409 RepID=UPI003F1977D7
MVLLTVLGLAVGGTAYVFLRDTLYTQVDAKLDVIGGRPPGGPFGSFDIDHPFRGEEIGSITLYYTSVANVRGGQVVPYTNTDNNPDTKYQELTDVAVAQLLSVPPDGAKSTVDVDGYGSFRVTAAPIDEGIVRVTALSLKNPNFTLLRVALVTGGAVLIALGIAGWAGALIVRRTLAPLDRVAATATRVSELRLDHGEVRLAQRVPEQDTDPRTEVGQVGAALNQMLDHVGNALEARHASEMQVRQFVADASHELRTPLAAIRGYAELSRRSRAAVPDEVAHVLNRVESEAKRMTGLVEDLLLLARLDAGRPLAHDPVDLTMLVVDTVSDAHAAGPGHNWQLDLPEEPVTVIGDGARLHQVLANLLANARTHTPEGTTVTVSVARTPGSAVLRVIDGGPGIPADLQPHIFERFARGDSSRSRAAGSTGLGLSIVHAVASAHGGTVAVDSRPGRTVFTVTLPLDPAAPVAVPPAEQLAQIAPPAN